MAIRPCRKLMKWAGVFCDMKRIMAITLALAALFMMTACGINTGATRDSAKEVSTSTASTASNEAAVSQAPAEGADNENNTEPQPSLTEEPEADMRLRINDVEVSIDWEENDSVAALRDLVIAQPLSIQMSSYGGFEQVGSLGTSLPRNDVQITTQAGDIVLYSGNNIVIFYGSNSWAYTRLGRIEGLSTDELTELLSGSDVKINIAYEER